MNMGSADYYTTIASAGTEIDFVKQIIAYITGLNPKITCLDDPDDEYNISVVGNDYFPAFRFCFNNNHLLTITRQAKISEVSNGFIAHYFLNDVEVSVGAYSMYFNYQRNGYRYDQAATRHYMIAHISSENFILLAIDSLYVSWSERIGCNTVYAGSGDTEYMAYFQMTNDSHWQKSNLFNIAGLTFYQIGSQINGTFISRFQYKSMPGYIDYVKNCVYGTSGNAQFNINSIYDCTERAVGDTVSLDDGAYIAVGAHQVVKILEA